MKILNCAPLLALVAGGLAVSAPANAAILKLSSASISATHEMLQAAALRGDDGLRLASSQQQQQQQQQQRQRKHVGEAGLVYHAPLSGFSV